MWQPSRQHRWKRHKDSQLLCYKKIQKDAPHIGGISRFNVRDWCWVGLKEFGCHQVLYEPINREHLTWPEMGGRAFNGHPTINYQPLLRPELCELRESGAKQAWTSQQWTASKSWFEKHVAVYVLNLDKNSSRWRSIHQILHALGIKATRVPGVDMRKHGALGRAKREGLIPTNFNFEHTQAAANKEWQGMGGIMGTIGCAAAHFRAQEFALRGKKPLTPIALVFEDDAIPNEDFIPRLWSLVKHELPCDWEVVSLRSMCPYGKCISRHLFRVQPDINEPVDRCRHGVNYGFQGVLYRTGALRRVQKRWRSVVFDERRPHCLDIDVALASISNAVSFYAVPFVQFPGFLRELRTTSSRFSLNQDQNLEPDG